MDPLHPHHHVDPRGVEAMNSTRGYLYGIYDSRGGTMFIYGASSREEADQFLLRKVFLVGEDPSMEVDEDPMDISDLFIREVTIYHVDPDLLGSGVDEDDLEWGREGFIIQAGFHTHWPPTEASFFDDTNGELEYVKAGDQPIKFRNGWDHPRWDDDAVSFSVHRYKEKD